MGSEVAIGSVVVVYARHLEHSTCRIRELHRVGSDMAPSNGIPMLMMGWAKRNCLLMLFHYCIPLVPLPQLAINYAPFRSFVLKLGCRVIVPLRLIDGLDTQSRPDSNSTKCNRH